MHAGNITNGCKRRYFMEKLFIFGASDPAYAQLKQIARRMRLVCERVSPDCFHYTLGELINGAADADVQNPNTSAPSQSLLLMCDLSSKRIDKLLFELRHAELSFDYKAILTPTNQDWTVSRLFLEMHRESAAFREQKCAPHNLPLQ